MIRQTVIEHSEPSSNGHGARFLFYSHDGFGLGHTRRNLAIAAALTQICPGSSVLLASGADDVHRLGLPPGVEALKLPAVRKIKNDQYVARRLRVEMAEIRAIRAALLEAAVKSFRPEVVLVDKHVLGAGGEFLNGLLALQAYGGRAVLGLRDILDEREAVLKDWTGNGVAEAIAQFYDRVLIYGARGVFDPVTEYDMPEALVPRISFCGYVVNSDLHAPLTDTPLFLTPQQSDRSIVLATTGGGEDGYALLETFIRAAEGSAWQGVVIGGPLAPEGQLTQLRAMAAQAGVIFNTFVPRLPVLFDSIDALVCMGGYNTLSEAMFQGMPTVCVPRVTPRSEQLLRARAFERMGLLRAVHPAELNAKSLRDQVQAALGLSRPELRNRVRTTLKFDGARNAAAELLDLARIAKTPREVKAKSALRVGVQ